MTVTIIRPGNRIITLGRGVQVVAPRGGAAASYWLDFDGSDDIITLPAGEGSEPSTAIFIEAWVTKPAALSNTDYAIITRGTNYNSGYMLGYRAPSATPRCWRLRFYLNGPANSGPQDVGGVVADGFADYIAAGWDGVNLYYFLNGALVKRVVSDATPISYTGTSWVLGRSASFGNPLWYFADLLSMVRVSNVCRHTYDYTPPQTFAVDANTVFLALCQEGAGTALTDAAHAHNGTFKGAGEPTWGAAITISDRDVFSGWTLWDNCQAMIPTITDTNVYVKCVDADTFNVYWKVHATGPTWCKQVYTRMAGSALFAYQAFVGIPDPTNDDPTSWTTDPATAITLAELSSNEYAFHGTPTGGAQVEMGASHGNESLDSEAWYVDDVLTALGAGDWASGAVIRYHAETHFTNPSLGATSVADLVRNTYFDRGTNYVRHHVAITWNVQTDLIFAYTGMLDFDRTVLTQATFEAGGTDYDATDASGEDGYERSSTIALWNPSSEIVAVSHLLDMASVRRFAFSIKRAFVKDDYVSPKAKAYFMVHQDAIADDDLYAGDTLTFDFCTRFYTNCGNHFLKTT